MASGEDGRALPARSPGQRLALAFFPTLAVVMSWVVYRGVTRTYFFADDFVCMLDIENLGFVRFVLKLFGGHILVLRNTIFYLVYQAFGFDPRPYYWMALLTHLLNVWLVFRIIRRFTNGNAALGCLGAALWGTSPLGIGTVGWYSVYGQQLVGTLTLVVLDGVLRQPPGTAPSGTRVAGWCGILLAGMTCFGIGIGVAMVFPLVLFLLVPATFGRPRLRAALLGFPLLVGGLYLGFRRLYPLLSPLPMSEAVLPGMALAHAAPIFAMLWHLACFSITGLLLGFAFVPATYPGPTSHLVVGLFAAGVAVVLVLGDATTRRHLVALALLSLAIYAMIAIGRANVYLAFEVKPALSARQVRYHYVGVIPIAIMLCVLLDRLTRRLPELAPVLLAAWLAFAGQAYAGSRWAIDRRPGIREWVANGLHTIETAIDSRPPGAVVTIDNEPSPIVLLGPGLTQASFPGIAALFVITHPGNVVRERRVQFVERAPAVYFGTRDPRLNLRMADLLVDPDAAATP